MIREYVDELRAKLVNAIEFLQFNGADVLTSTKTDGRGLPIKNVQDPTDDQDVVTKKYLQDNGSGGVATVNDKAPTTGNVNVTIDDVAKKGDTSTVPVKVPANAYGAGWAANSEVPTKGDIYTEMEKKQNASQAGGNQIITLPAGATVEQRVLAAVEGVDYPNGWVLTADGKDLIITHNTGNNLGDITVCGFNGTTRQLRVGSAAYGTWYDLDGNGIRIQSLATINAKISINLMFMT